MNDAPLLSANRADWSDTVIGGDRVRLRTLVSIRWIAVVGQLSTLVVVYGIFGIRFDILPALLVVSLSVFLNLYLGAWYRPNHLLGDGEAALQLAYDLLQLVLLLYLTGGLQNPFSVLMLVPVTISATVLSRRSTYTLLVTAILASFVLTFWHEPLPWSGTPPEVPELFLVGIWVGLAFCMLFLALYAAQVSAEARLRSRALAATQAALAREQRLSALGTLAAAAAHELGTPLGTITLAAKELSQEIDQDDPIYEEVAQIRTQAHRCRDILARLAQPDEGLSADHFARQPLEAIVREAIKPYETTRPISISAGQSSPEEGHLGQPVFERRPEIIHALGNFVENAVSYARQQVWIDLTWTDSTIQLKIRDDGPGFDAAALRSLGEPYVSTRRLTALSARDQASGGLGLGVFIAKTLLESTGASVVFRNARLRGAVVEITWPRAAIDLSLEKIDKKTDP